MIVSKGGATDGRLLAGWAIGDARTDSGPVSGTSYPEVTNSHNICAGCEVV